MAWTPEPEPLGQLAHLLKDSMNPHDKSARMNAELALKQAGANPDINNYLGYLCITLNPVGGLSDKDYAIARSAAAIMLKNNVKTTYKSMAESSKSYLRSTILRGLQDQDRQIRNYSGNVVTEFVRQGGILGWPQVLGELIALVENQDGSVAVNAQDGAMGALLKICEDNKKALNKVYEGQRPLDFLIPKLIEFTASPTSQVRSKALGTLNFFIDDPMPAAMQENVEKFMLQLFTLAQNDQDQEVRRFICRSFTKVANSAPTMVLPHLSGIIDYIVIQQKSDPESDLALDAAEFFFENCEVEELQDGLGQHLDKIIPALLESMIYSQEDQAKLEAEADEDAEKDDKEEDIKPQFASAKEKGITVKPEAGTNGQSLNGYAYEEVDPDLSDGELEDEDYGEDPEEMWNLRKCSAAALDTFATRFHERVFEFTLPYLKDNLNHAEWPNREAAVLALGAISVGCMETVQPSLPDLVPFLITLLSDQQPVVRQITCWALGRYSSWASHLPEAGKRQFFEPMMEGILFRMLDNNKRVQEAAASAFANLEDQATTEITPYCVIIAQQFVKCFGKYKDKNMYILYDCVQTLAEHVGPDMAQPAIVDLLMPALITRWHTVSDKSREMFPLLECLAYIATALGEAFAPFAKPFFSRCITIIQENLEEGNLAASNAYMDTPDKDFLVTSLDLLSAIIQALDGARSSELVATANPNFFELLAYCMRDSNNDVKQSAFALLGDCAIYVFGQLQPYLDSIMQITTMQLDLAQTQHDPDTAFRVINNACWSVGEIAMRHQAGMSPYVEDLLQKLGTILFSQQVPESLNQNAAIALGRLGLGNSQKLAPHLVQFAAAFLTVMQQVEWTDEKLDAFRGFVQIVLDNPQALEQCLLPFFSAIATVPSATRNSPVLQAEKPLEGFKKALMQYKSLIPDFDGFISHLPQEQQYELKQSYGL